MFLVPCFSLSFFSFSTLSLDVGFCDDIPLMAARSFLICSSYLLLFLFYFYLRFKTLWERMARKRVWMDVWMDRMGWDGKEKRKTKDGTPGCRFLVPPFSIFFGSLAVRRLGRRRKKERKSVLYSGILLFLFGGEIDSVWRWK
jgi:hypothetical protein